MQALTKTGRIITKTVEGLLHEIKSEATFGELEILSLDPDFLLILKSVYFNRHLSTYTLANFFMDFARTQDSGLSISESIEAILEANSDPILKASLKIINNSLNDGRPLREAFANSKCFPRIVIISLSAAEKSGCVPEISGILGDYFKFNNENNKRTVGALIYPSAVLCALTIASVIISINLVPELSRMLPPSSTNNLATKLLLSYSMFMKSYWWIACLLVVFIGGGIKYLWADHKRIFSKFIYDIPFLGIMLKDIEFSRLFLIFYVYQKSGIPIIETITNIFHDDRSYINEKLLDIQNKIIKGQSLGEAFRSDDFFPPFIWHNLVKGQKSGELVKYLEDTYHFYDQKSKESLNILISMINPVLLSVAIAFLGFIVCNFFLPIYNNMAIMGGVFR